MTQKVLLKYKSQNLKLEKPTSHPPPQLLYTLSAHDNHLSSSPRNNQPPAVDPGLPLCQHLHGDDWLSPLQMDSVRILSMNGFRTKPKDVHSIDVYPILSLNHLTCRHLQSQWTWSRNQHSSSAGDHHGIFLPGACAHERNTQPSSFSTFLWFFSNSINCDRVEQPYFVYLLHYLGVFNNQV